jgi:hypothetical protein
MEARNLLDKLDKYNLSIIIMSGSKTLYSSGASGIKPLVEAIDKLGRRVLKDSTVVDKIIGKASALLICYFGAKKAIAKVMSSGGLRVLDLYGVEHIADTLVNEIRNRTDTDFCPFEKLVLNVERPADAFRLMKQQLRNGVC